MNCNANANFRVPNKPSLYITPTFRGTDEVSGTGLYSFLEVYEDLRCQSDYDATKITSIEEYMAALDNSNEYTESVDATIGGTAYGFSSAATINYRFSETTKENKTKEFFSKMKGEIQLLTKTCQLYEIKIAQYLRPKFTQNFIRGLEDLHSTLNQEENVKENAAIKFIKNFGTHFSREVSFGGRMYFERRYTTRSKTDKENELRRICAKKEAKVKLEFGKSSPKPGDPSFDTSFETGAENEKCNESKNKQTSTDEIGIDSVKSTSFGTFITEKDATLNEENFKSSVPIR